MISCSTMLRARGDAETRPSLNLSAETRASKKALIVEDVKVVEKELKGRHYECDRLTHRELLSSAGTEYTGKLFSGEYSLLWISSPQE